MVKLSFWERFKRTFGLYPDRSITEVQVELTNIIQKYSWFDDVYFELRMHSLYYVKIQLKDEYFSFNLKTGEIAFSETSKAFLIEQNLSEKDFKNLGNDFSDFVTLHHPSIVNHWNFHYSKSQGLRKSMVRRGKSASYSPPEYR